MPSSHPRLLADSILARHAHPALPCKSTNQLAHSVAAKGALMLRSPQHLRVFPIRLVDDRARQASVRVFDLDDKVSAVLVAVEAVDALLGTGLRDEG